MAWPETVPVLEPGDISKLNIGCRHHWTHEPNIMEWFDRVFHETTMPRTIYKRRKRGRFQMLPNS